MAARLTDPWFDAEFIGHIADDGQSHYRQGGEIDGAQGLFLWCPCGYADPRYQEPNKGRPHGLIIPFSNPRNAPPVPATFGPFSRNSTTRPRWAMSGTGLHDLTLQPSIAVGKPECWHGYITNGEITP